MANLKLVSSNTDAQHPKPEEGPFTLGAQVHLLSGGPLMTIEVSGPKYSETVWFDDVGGHQGGKFLNATLMLYVKPKRAPRKPKPQ